jgi:hypothetical protein
MRAQWNSEPNSVGEPSQEPESRQRFWELFRHHWQAGTGLDGQLRKRGWTYRAFGESLKSAGLPAPDPDTVASWLHAERWPKASRKEAILTAFFPRDRSDDAARAEMSRAWEDGERVPVPAPQPAPTTDAERPRWVRFDEASTEGLAEIALAEPKPHSNEDGVFRIEGDPLVTVADAEIDGRTLRIGVSSVLLCFHSEAYAIRPESLISKRNDSGQMKTVVGGVEFLPRGTAQCVDGPLLEDDYFAVVESKRAGEAPMMFALKTARRSFRVIETDTRGQPKPSVSNEEQDAVLNILLGKDQEKDSLGRIVLAKISMRRIGD